MLNFAIFRAKNKRTNNSPDYTSGVQVEQDITLKAGTKYQLAGWDKTARNGNMYISVVIKEDTYKREEQTSEAGWESFQSAPSSNTEEPF